MKKKILKYTISIIILLILIFGVYLIMDYMRLEKQRTQYPYSEIQIKNNQYYYKDELLTGMSYILGNNSDSISLMITNGKLFNRELYTNNKQTITTEYYHENGNLFSKHTNKNNKRDGIEEYYSENGKLSSRTNYKNDLKNGLSERFHENGTIYTKTLYVNDKKEGIEETYEDNGTISHKTMYVNDKKEGTEEWYNENGKLSYTREYKNDVEIKENSDNSSNSQSSGGVFTYESGYRRMKITITPEKWFGWLEDGSGDGYYSGKTIIRGKMNGSDLYDENGIEKRGYVSGSTIYYNDPLGEIKLSK